MLLLLLLLSRPVVLSAGGGACPVRRETDEKFEVLLKKVCFI